MNPFASRISRNSWEVPVAALSLVLGVMISMAWITDRNRKGRIPLLGMDQQERVTQGPIDLQIKYRELSKEVKNLRDENTKLQNAMANHNNQGKVLNDSLQELKIFTGMTAAKGPGITVTLRDSPKAMSGTAGPDDVIHDTDVLKVVNELWAAGAEAITVNGHRVSVSTAFRCVGPVIHVQNMPIASPVMIRAIGDSETLVGAMNMPGGVLSEIRRTDEAMVGVDAVKEHLFEPYSGTTSRRWVNVPKAEK